MPSYSLSSPLSHALLSGNNPAEAVAAALRAKMPAKDMVLLLYESGLSDDEVALCLKEGGRLFMTRSAFWNMIPGLIIAFLGFIPLLIGFDGSGVVAAIIFFIGGIFVAIGIFQLCFANFGKF